MQCIGTAYEDCPKEARYIRHTQFAGSHPFCAEHAMQEDDFLDCTSYLDWEYIGDD